MRKRQIRNALGGMKTNPEQSVYPAMGKENTQDRIDTNIATIIRCVRMGVYDIKLLKDDTIIKNVPLKGSVPYNLSPGKEVLVIYRGGFRYQIMIDDQTNSGIDSSNQMQSRYSDDTEFKSLMSDHALKNSRFILIDDSLDMDLSVGYGASLLPKSLKLRDVPAANLPDHASVHAQGGSDPITPEALIGTKFGITQLITGTIVVNTALVTANSRIFLTGQDSNVTGSLNISARVPGVSFTIISSKGTDSGKVAWLILEP